MSDLFRRVDEISASPTERIVGAGELTAVPRALVSTFGQPTRETFDRESLGAYYFRGQNGEPFMLFCRAHDLGWWSMMRLRSRFWLDGDARVFTISTLRGGEVSDFTRWIADRLAMAALQ
jgi:hypothetical protein